MPDFRKPSFRSRASTATTSMIPMRERGSRHDHPAETPTNVDAFAEALDRLVNGDQVHNMADPDLAALVDSATDLYRERVAESGTDHQGLGMALNLEEKKSIWEEVLRSRQEATMSAGNSTSSRSVVKARSFPAEAEQVKVGSAMANHPLSPARKRPSQMGRLRARIDIQPVVTMLLVAALLIAIVAGYRGFGGGSGSLVTPTASAHGNPELAAVAAAVGSPESSPSTAFSCDVSGTPVAQDSTLQPDSYGYEKRGPISEAQGAAIPGLMGPFAGCMYGLNYQGLASVSTSRYVTDLQQAISGTPADIPGISRRAGAMEKVWVGPLPVNSEPIRVLWIPSDRGPIYLNVFVDTAQRLDDGRIGMLATIAPQDVSVVPDRSWLVLNNRAMLSVWFIGFQETDEGLRVDEMFGMCGGSQCVPMFGADAATPEASPAGSPTASPVASLVASSAVRP